VERDYKLININLEIKEKVVYSLLVDSRTGLSVYALVKETGSNKRLIKRTLRELEQLEVNGRLYSQQKDCAVVGQIRMSIGETISIIFGFIQMTA